MSKPNETFIVTDFGPEDLPRLVPLMRAVQAVHAAALPELFHDRASDGDLLAHLSEAAQGGALFLAAVTPRQEVLGLAVVLIQGRPADCLRHAATMGVLDVISVAPHARRRGIGRALVAAMEARLRTRGIAGWRASHWAFNDASAGLMAATGAKVALVTLARAIDPE